MAAARRILAEVYGLRFKPLLISVAAIVLRTALSAAMTIDEIVFPRLRVAAIRSPVIIAGPPRTGTTFLQRFLCDNAFGAGLQLYRMVYPSLLVQKLLTPIAPYLESVSPARHHKTAAHDTNLLSIETDDAAALFRHWDGFFLYAFILAHAEDDVRDAFDPALRHTSQRDFDWLVKLWKRSLVFTGHHRIIAKMFSAGARMPDLLDRFPDAKVLYLARDPLVTIPSAMSLVTGVQDSAFGFWSLPAERRTRYLDRLYSALVTLLLRFHADWESGKIDRTRVHIVRYDRMMSDFEGTMAEICEFIGHTPTPEQCKQIQAVAGQQRSYRSAHRYDPTTFGLDADRVRRDTAAFSNAFLAQSHAVANPASGTAEAL